MSNTIMYDDINLPLIPADAEAVAGYVNGRWPTFPKLAALFPRAKRVSIAVNASADADFLDIETGDATPAEAPGWYKRQKARGVGRPGFYANRSTMPAVLNALAAVGVTRAGVRLWAADYTFFPHFNVFRWGAKLVRVDGTQYTDKAKGRSLDASICRPSFFTDAHSSDAGKRDRWQVRLARAQSSLRHCLAYRSALRYEHHDKGLKYYLSTIRMHRLKLYIAALEHLLKK